MSVLYPRLLDRAAERLYETFKEEVPETLRDHARTRHPEAVFTATGGRRVEERELRALREVVVDLAKHSGYPRPPAPSARSSFDLAVARHLHAEMGLVPAEASVRAVWAFISLVVVPDVTYWRFPNPPKDRVLATDITRHTFGRLWWRAHLLHDGSRADAYELLDTFGEAGFDQIFARRRSLGGSSALIRALADYWPRAELGDQTERLVLREALKRLLRHGAFQEFESLDPDVMRLELQGVVADSVAALST